MNNSAKDFDDINYNSSSYVSKVAQSSTEHDVKQYKVIFIGNPYVGKTSIIQRYVTKQFKNTYTSSIGIAYERINVKVNSNTLVKLNLWDTAGSEKYKSVTRTYFVGADVVLFVYDITNEQSFTELSLWMTTVNETCSEGYLSYIIANKTDLNAQRTVSTSKGSVYADKHGCKFMEISAKTGTNIDELFTNIAEALYNKTKQNNNVNVCSSSSHHSSISLHKQHKQQQQQRFITDININTRKSDQHQPQNSNCC